MKYHISNSYSFQGSLKMYLRKNKRNDESVIIFDDNFSFGPIENFLSDTGKMKRNNWNLTNIHDVLDEIYPHRKNLEEEEDNYEFQLYKNFEKQISKIQKDDTVKIYIDNSAGDYLFLGYIYTIYPHKNIELYINAGENSLGATHYEKIGEIEKQKTIMSNKQEEVLKTIFQNIPKENLLRIWKNNEIKFLEIDFFDTEILEKYITNNWKTSINIMGNFLGNCEILEIRNDTFIANRLYAMGKKGLIQIKYKENIQYIKK